MKIGELVSFLEQIAPPFLQEEYDNAGLLTGSNTWECSGVLVTLDVTEEVVMEAIARKCNLIVAHHPIIFRGLKKITGKNYVERTIISAIKNDIAIYAIHTNLDNIIEGVNGRIADKLGLINRRVLAPMEQVLKKLFVFVPVAHTNLVRDAIFSAGGGHIGNYNECSFSSVGVGTFKAGSQTNPFVGERGTRHLEKENRIEVVFPAWMQDRILKALVQVHPYEEVAYDIVALNNTGNRLGAGLVGELAQPVGEEDLLATLKTNFGLSVIRHTRLSGKMVQTVALCGGAGSFLIANALAQNADIFVSSDFKYHEFFDADNRIVIADIGHFEIEQFTRELLYDFLTEKFPTFAVLKSDTPTNPVHYYL